MIISWNVTKECNLNCLHCYRDAGRRSDQELDTEQAKELIREIAKAGFKILILSGGEPLLRKDIYELIAEAKAQGLRPVLGTNGTLMEGNVIDRLKKSGLCRAGISLDSIKPDIHDGFRQKKGSWQKTVDAMHRCRENGLEFQVHTTVTTYNYDGIEAITDIASKIGAKAHHIFFLIPTGRGKDIESSVISKDQYRKLLVKILEKQKDCPIELKPVCAPQFVPLASRMNVPVRFQRGCLAGISYCCILPNGSVHPCPYFPLSVGNVRDTKFSSIWRENALLKTLRAQEYTGYCSSCKDKDHCGGCRARAFTLSDNFMGEDPECIFNQVAEAVYE